GAVLNTANRILVTTAGTATTTFGISSTGPPSTIANNFAVRPETRLNGAVVPANDAAVTALYSYGELPYCIVPAQVIKAVITNNGGVALTNLPVTLNVTGIDTFTDTQTVASIAPCGGQAIVTF